MENQELNELTELQLAKMYRESQDENVLTIINERIKDLYENADPYNLTNEQLVLIIHTYNDDYYWGVLYEKTKNSIHSTIHKYANAYHKREYLEADNNEREFTDLFSEIRMGWIRAVNTYDLINKATAEFIPYACTLMYQAYIKHTKKFDEDHEGKSVRASSTEDAYSTTSNDADTHNAKMIENIYEDKNSLREIEQLEIHELLKQKLDLLKAYDKDMYDILYLNFFGGFSQVQLADKYGTNQVWISRQIKKGKRFLYNSMTRDEKDGCFL